MEELNLFLKRVATYTQIYLYNKSIVDPYLLSTHGLVITNKHHQYEQNRKVTISYAICENNACNLKVQFDQSEFPDEIKDPLSISIRDHDDQCPFKSIQSIANPTNYQFLNIIGLSIFRQAFNNLLHSQKYIQLSPVQVINILNIRQSASTKINFVLEMFKQFDRNLHKKEVLKVQSINFLATFGWQFSNFNEHELLCRFCGKTENIFKFISPSQCTLMNIPSGFEFISSHRPWCCLIRQEQPLWRELLKQAIVDKLKNIEGKINKTPLQIRCKDLQDKTIQIYNRHQTTILTLKDSVSQFKNRMCQKYNDDNSAHNTILQTFMDHANRLDAIINNSQSNIQRIIKKIKLE